MSASLPKKWRFSFYLFLMKSSILKWFCIHINHILVGVQYRLYLSDQLVCRLYLLKCMDLNRSILVSTLRCWTNVWIPVGMNCVIKVKDALELTLLFWWDWLYSFKEIFCSIVLGLFFLFLLLWRHLEDEILTISEIIRSEIFSLNNESRESVVLWFLTLLL